MPALEDYSIFDLSSDNQDNNVEADMNNLNTTIQVSPNPTTRIHKDYPLNYMIRDLQSATQTRNMSKNLEEYRSKLDRGYAGRASTIQVTRSLDFSGVYVYQPPGFEDPDFPDRVYKVEKALYELHQAPKAWYETLSTYLLDNGFQRGKIDKNLFIRRDKEVKTASTPIETQKPLLKDEDDTSQSRFNTSSAVQRILVQLQALVDGMKIIITESIVKRDLQLEDAEGVDCCGDRYRLI
ncbi:putative ribonuclease H-like domain-containing protein [Tanacetum coccineum]